jgi:hypothetical protein
MDYIIHFLYPSRVGILQIVGSKVHDDVYLVFANSSAVFFSLLSMK